MQVDSVAFILTASGLLAQPIEIPGSVARRRFFLELDSSAPRCYTEPVVYAFSLASNRTVIPIHGAKGIHGS